MEAGVLDTSIVSVINMKGGVGKTTITFNLAYSLAQHLGKKVLVVDFDPQANSSEAFLTYTQYQKHQKEKLMISEIFTDLRQIVGPVSDKNPKIITLDDMICRVKNYSNGGYIDLVPSELELSNVLERSSGANLEDRLKLILRNKKNRYDIILVDCSPTYSILTTNSLKASDFVLIPVKPDPFSSRGIPLLLQKIDTHNNASSEEDKIGVLGIVFSMYKYNASPVFAEDVKKEILREHKNVFNNEVWYTEYYSKGIIENNPIFQTPAQEHFKRNFRKFTDEFLEKLIRR
jgi:chromosome partitioning protein